MGEDIRAPQFHNMWDLRQPGFAFPDPVPNTRAPGKVRVERSGFPKLGDPKERLLLVWEAPWAGRPGRARLLGGEEVLHGGLLDGGGLGGGHLGARGDGDLGVPGRVSVCRVGLRTEDFFCSSL